MSTTVYYSSCDLARRLPSGFFPYLKVETPRPLAFFSPRIPPTGPSPRCLRFSDSKNLSTPPNSLSPDTPFPPIVGLFFFWAPKIFFGPRGPPPPEPSFSLMTLFNPRISFHPPPPKCCGVPLFSVNREVFWGVLEDSSRVFH